MKKGQNLILTAHYGSTEVSNMIAYSPQCEIDFDCETIEVCSPVSGRWRDYTVGTAGWSISATIYCQNWENTKEAIGNVGSGQKLHVCFYDPDDNLHYYGDVLITKIGIPANVGSIVKVSLSMQGCGEPKEMEEATGKYYIGSKKTLEEVDTELISTGRCVEVIEKTVAKMNPVKVLKFESGYKYAFHIPNDAAFVLYEGAYSDLQSIISSASVVDDNANTILVSKVKRYGTVKIPYFEPNVSGTPALTMLIGYAQNGYPKVYVEKRPA